jgi:hypothetical protein
MQDNPGQVAHHYIVGLEICGFIYNPALGWLRTKEVTEIIGRSPQHNRNQQKFCLHKFRPLFAIIRRHCQHCKGITLQVLIEQSCHQSITVAVVFSYREEEVKFKLADELLLYVMI